jgi:hypothetical protein
MATVVGRDRELEALAAFLDFEQGEARADRASAPRQWRHVRHLLAPDPAMTRQSKQGVRE